MKLQYRFKIALLAFLFLGIIPVILEAKWDKLAVLVYHHIQEKVSSDVSCTPKQFDSQMNALIESGYTPLSLSQFRQYLVAGLEDIGKPILITFDDGYESVYQYALPVARKYKIPMIVFVVTSRIGLKPQFARYLSEKQIREMDKSAFFEFGSHTHSLHVDSMKIFDAFEDKRNNPVCRLLKRDLRMSRDKLYGITGKNPIAIAWPYGKFCSEFTNIARGVGFKLHFTSRYGYNEEGFNPYLIKRIPVSSRDNEKTIIEKLRGYR